MDLVLYILFELVLQVLELLVLRVLGLLVLQVLFLLVIRVLGPLFPLWFLDLVYNTIVQSFSDWGGSWLAILAQVGFAEVVFAWVFAWSSIRLVAFSRFATWEASKVLVYRMRPNSVYSLKISTRSSSRDYWLYNGVILIALTIKLRAWRISSLASFEAWFWYW